MAASVLTVSQVNFFVKSLLEGDGRLADVLITGEISNYTDHYKSGHLYFSLKDARSVIKAVMFANSAKRLRFRPAEGMKVIVRGRVSVYEPSGQYQLYAEDMQPDGIGALSIAYEQLREKLAGEELFNPERKKSLPRYPQKIGVITSPTGAAVRDILQVASRRWPMAEIVFCPVLVQGEGAPAQLTAAVRMLNEAHACDVIILGRGGGSLEDLWAFNDESLARAVAASSIPIVSAVGHETDFTICDFAADLRAPTPSAAAELCTPELQEELEKLATFQAYFQEKALEKVESLRQGLDFMVLRSPLGKPEELLTAPRERLARLAGSLLAETAGQVENRQKEFALLGSKLDALSPLRVLARGYAVVSDEKGNVVRDAGLLPEGALVTIRTAKGSARAEILKREDG